MIGRAIVDEVSASIEHDDRLPYHTVWRKQARMTVGGIPTTVRSMFVKLHGTAHGAREALEPGPPVSSRVLVWLNAEISSDTASAPDTFVQPDVRPTTCPGVSLWRGDALDAADGPCVRITRSSRCYAMGPSSRRFSPVS